MGMGVLTLKTLNRLFPRPVHPFNLAAAGKMSYAEWQFHKGGDTLAFYRPFAGEASILRDKTVLDIGCGAGGKTLYYASRGARQVVGIDVVPSYRTEAVALARKLGLEEKATFLTGDAAAMPFADNAFDSIIANDVMEHLPRPDQALVECHRVLTPGGRLYVNFPPLYHPFGAHLSDAIGIPWVHVLFPEETLITAYKDLVAGQPDAPARLALRFGRDESERERITYINRMTISRFEDLAAACPLRVVYRDLVPLRPQLAPLARVLREHMVKMVVYIFQKD